MSEAPKHTKAEAPAAPVAEAPQVQVIQQHVVTEKSLKGIGGALIFWIIVFALAAIGYIMAFTALLAGSDASVSSGQTVVGLLFTPLLAVGFAGATILIAMQKKLAVIASVGTLALSALYMVISQIISYSQENSQDGGVPVLVGSILVSLFISGLFASYFLVSKRAKQTLIN